MCYPARDQCASAEILIILEKIFFVDVMLLCDVTHIFDAVLMVKLVKFCEN